MTKTKFSISAASRITGYSRPTISRHIQSQPISIEKNELGHVIIDKSELLRVYGDRCDFTREEKRGEKSETVRSDTKVEKNMPHVSAVQDQLIQRIEAENEHLKLALDKALDYQSSVGKLLEVHTQNDSEKWQATLDAMSDKLANETQKQIDIIQQRHNKEIAKLKRLYFREVNKTWLEKLFQKRRAGTSKRE